MKTDNDVVPASDDRRRVVHGLQWLVVQFGLTAFAMLQTFASTLSVASCTATSCDYAAFVVSINTLYIGALALLVVSCLAVIMSRAHGRAVSLPPIVCSVLLLLLLAVTYAAGRAALTLPLFGNRVG